MRKAEMRAPAPPTDEMPTEIDFSNCTRGRFFKPGTKLVLPAYLEAEAPADPPTAAPDKSGTRND